MRLCISRQPADSPPAGAARPWRTSMEPAHVPINCVQGPRPTPPGPGPSDPWEETRAHPARRRGPDGWAAQRRCCRTTYCDTYVVISNIAGYSDKIRCTCAPQDHQLMAIERAQRGQGAPVWSLQMSLSNARRDRGPRGTAHALSEEAERCASAAAGSRSAAEAVSSRLQAVVRLTLP